MNRILLTLATLFMMPVLFAQEESHCGTDEMRHELHQLKPERTDYIRQTEKELESFTKSFQYQQRDGDPYIIPVVFHVIHDYGPENISDEQIYDAIEQVNIQLRKLNEDTTDIVDDFKQIAADTEIEIRLAQLDPNGNCTSGITRTASELTHVGDHELKSLIQWPPDQYLNIYVANQAAGLAGHAMMPADADTIPEWDGIVMQHSYVGTIGTSTFFRRTVVTHEIGHYLNLQHIWGGNNVPDYPYLVVAQPENCDYDDGVADTPNTIGWQSCPLNGESCGTLDNVQNYMDYAYCARMFTEGQRDRMHAALNSPIANRNNLWSQANLEATGTAGNDILCHADFDADRRILCAGQSITFIDKSYHGITGWEWNFEGGDPSTSTEGQPTVTYDTPGVYEVSLTVEQGAEQASTTKEGFVVVQENPGVQNYVIIGFEGYTNPNQSSKFFLDKHFEDTWEINTDLGAQSNRSLWINNFDNPSKKDHTFITRTIDLSEYDEAVINFDYAYAKRDEENADRLRIALSTNCGESWTTGPSLTFNATDLNTAPLTTTAFIPQEHEWENTSVTIPASFCVENLMIRFQYIPDGGNNFYIDNINVTHPDLVSVENRVTKPVFHVFPNPNNGHFQLTLEGVEESRSTHIEVYDQLGRQVLTKVTSNVREDIDLSNVGSGIYILRVTSGKEVFTEKLVVNK